MKRTITKAALAALICLITAATAAYATPSQTASGNTPNSGHETALDKIGHGTADLAKGTWAVTRTIVYSPVIAWQVMRGERPLFPHETASRGSASHSTASHSTASHSTASREKGHREQVALTGHRAKSRTEANPPSRPNEPPPI